MGGSLPSAAAAIGNKAALYHPFIIKYSTEAVLDTSVVVGGPLGTGLEPPPCSFTQSSSIVRKVLK